MAIFCSSLMCSLGMLIRYFLDDFEMVPVAPITTGITFVSTFHIHGTTLILRTVNATTIQSLVQILRDK